MSDWSTSQNGGGGSPGWIKVDFLSYGPTDGSKVWKITDPTNSDKNLPTG